jgi:uncharacterized membrane protein YbhN (UPF0104 family)
MTFKKTLTTLLKIALTAVVVFFVYRQVAGHWDEIKSYQWQVDWVMFLLSVLLGLGTFVVMASNWQRLIAGFGHQVPLRKSFRIFYLADLGRYIPGKIWPLLGILYLTKKEGIPPERATASFVLVQMFAIPASLLVFVIALQFEPRILVDQVAVLGEKSTYLLTGLMLLFSTVVVVWPQRLLGIANALLRRLSRPEVHFALDKTVALRLFVGYSIGWFCYGVARVSDRLPGPVCARWLRTTRGCDGIHADTVSGTACPGAAGFGAIVGYSCRSNSSLDSPDDTKMTRVTLRG